MNVCVSLEGIDLRAWVRGTYTCLPYWQDIAASLEKRGYYIFSARLTRGFFEFSGFSRCQKPSILDPRGLVRVVKSRFCGYNSQTRIFNTSRGRKDIIYPFRAAISRCS